MMDDGLSAGCNTTLKYKNININHDTLWTSSFDLNNFTFIDLLKGIIPKFLIDILLDFNLSYKNIKDIIFNFSQHLYNIIRECVWLPRCDTQSQKEINAGITSRKKTKKEMCKLFL